MAPRGAPPPDPGIDEIPSPARRDGRRAHVLDRAAEYARLADAGLTVTAIARRRRKSKAHVSILLRLGRLLAGLPEDERAALRSPRVTWRLVQGIVRADVDAASVRRQLRAAVGGFSTHTRDRRRRADRGAGAGGDAGASVAASGAAGARGITTAPGVAWGWDAAWFARDPAGYAAAHHAHLRYLHEAVARRAEAAVRARQTAATGVVRSAVSGAAGTSATSVDAGQGLRLLQRRLARLARPAPGAAAATAGTAAGTAATPAEREALAAFAALGRVLAGEGVVSPRAGADPGDS